MLWLYRADNQRLVARLFLAARFERAFGNDLMRASRSLYAVKAVLHGG
jgi:hypothetical protein